MPQRLAYLALHTDYSEGFVTSTDLLEDACGDVVVKRLLRGGRGHWGPLEHPSMTLAIRADHNTIMQLRTHRIASFDVQSMRYTGDRIIDVARGDRPLEDVFYFRPSGSYIDREGRSYVHSDHHVHDEKVHTMACAQRYKQLVEEGRPPEHARNVLSTNYLQNAAITANLRSWLHLLEVRGKPNAQHEIRQIIELIERHVQRWVPEIFDWWHAQRRHKAILAP